MDLVVKTNDINQNLDILKDDETEKLDELKIEKIEPLVVKPIKKNNKYKTDEERLAVQRACSRDNSRKNREKKKELAGEKIQPRHKEEIDPTHVAKVIENVKNHKKKYYEKNSEELKARMRENYYLRKYGKTKEEYEKQKLEESKLAGKS